MCKRFAAVLASLSLFSSSYSQLSDSASYYFGKGLEEKKARRFREAEKNFVKSDRFNPGQLNTLVELAQAYLVQSRYTEALLSFQKAEKIDASNLMVIENLATLSFNHRKWDDAIRYANRMKELKSSEPANYIIGKSYFEQENYGKAIQFLNLAAKEEPARGEIPYAIAKAYLDMSNYRQSAAFYEKAIALDSSRTNWIYEAGLVFYAIPDYKRSLYFMELAAEKGITRNNNFLENLGNAYINAGQYEKGVAVLKEVLERKPADQEILYQIAQANYNAKNYQEAIDYWDQVLGNDKSNARALYMIGLAYQKKGEKQKGVQLCDKAIEMDPSLNSLKQKQGNMAM